MANMSKTSLNPRMYFVCFQVTELPWNQDELAPETLPFVDKLAHINKHGILTINSQPNVNAAPSTDPVAGWGRPGGYVFQKVNMLCFFFLVLNSMLIELFAVPNSYFTRLVLVRHLLVALSCNPA